MWDKRYKRIFFITFPIGCISATITAISNSIDFVGFLMLLAFVFAFSIGLSAVVFFLLKKSTPQEKKFIRTTQGNIEIQ